MVIRPVRPILIDSAIEEYRSISLPTPLAKFAVEKGMAVEDDQSDPLAPDYSNARSIGDAELGLRYILHPDGRVRLDSQVTEDNAERTMAWMLYRFSSMAKEQQESLDQKFKAFMEGHAKAIEIMRTDFAATRVALEREVSALKEAAEHGREQEKVLQLTQSNRGSHLVSEGYEKKAKQQETVVRNWQIGTWLAVAAWLGMLIYRFLDLGSTTADGYSPERLSLFLKAVDFPGALILAGMNLPFLAIVGFCATQMVKSQGVLRELTRMQLELRTIGPYVESMPAKDQVRIKVAFAERFFSGTLSTPAWSDNEDEVKPQDSAK